MLFILTELVELYLLRLEYGEGRASWLSALMLIVAGELSYERNERVGERRGALAGYRRQIAANRSRPHFQLAFAYHFEANRCDNSQSEYDPGGSEIGGRTCDKADSSLLVDWARGDGMRRQVEESLANRLKQAATMERGQRTSTRCSARFTASTIAVPESLEALRHRGEELNPNYAMIYVNRGTTTTSP